MKIAMQTRLARGAMVVGLIGCLGGAADAAVRIEGQAQVRGGALAGSTVSLWAASADAPARLAQVQSDADGRFVVSADSAPGGASSLYLVASGGTPAINKAAISGADIEIIHAEKVQLAFTGLVQWVRGLDEKWDPDVIAVEAIGTGFGFTQHLRDGLGTKNVHRVLSHGANDKLRRMELASPR